MKSKILFSILGMILLLGAVPFIIDIVPTEKFRIMFSGNDNGIFLNYMTNTSYAPETPSIIMTVSKISEITP